MDDVERAFRAVHGQAVATLTRVYGDITLAEDAVQEAYLTALRRWPQDGVPDNPAGWIVTVARHRAVDVLRRERRGRDLTEQMATERRETNEPGSMQDDQLRLVFTCCHPAIRVEDQVALTLRLIAGLTPTQVAAAFLVTEEAMAKRLVRAKYKIKAAHIPYRVPDDAELPDRLPAVLSVLYLIYNAGADDLARRDLRAEAIRLTRVLAALLPAEPEVVGLLALMLLSDARMPARGDGADIVLLKEQDRALWDRSLIGEGQALVLACMRGRRLGPFQLQAAIQALHCAAPRYDETDWPAILRFYDRLVAVLPTPVVTLNRAVATAEVEGAEEGLAALDRVAEGLDGYHLLHASRGWMLDKLGRQAEAADAYDRAAALARTDAEVSFLSRRRAELAAEVRTDGAPGVPQARAK